MGMRYFFDKNDQVFSLDDMLDEELLAEQVLALELTEINEQTAKIKANTPEIQAINEHNWVKFELDSIQVELMYHWTGDAQRASATEDEWKQYAIALRDYTTIDNNGSISIVGKQRPTRPV
ncbi:hypothetical protein [Vibrio cincinnatiensis]|uniref:hypothetical protein n=1 Tax=Vibrio cincinnatiensis TaxID=675 RepID=UPI001EE05BBE|nr:hypothetical protein [Vibrio cincinnatiensis]MCG3724777.1 hypothetical protein [Vibrio cincinnatiensis]